MIIEHRLEDVLWRNVDRIILMKDGGILADLHPDELLSTVLLGAIVSDSYALRRSGYPSREKTFPCGFRDHK